MDHWKRDPWIACIACIACIALVIDIGRSWKRDRQIEERDKFNVTIQRKWRRCSILKKGKGRVRSFKNWKILRHSARLGSIWVPPTLIDFFFNIWNFIIIFYFFDDKEQLSRESLYIFQLYKLVNMQLSTLQCKICSFAWWHAKKSCFLNRK